MITLHWLYALAGAMFAAFALLSALDRSNRKLRQCRLLGADGAQPARRSIGDFGNGLLVLGLAGLAGFGFIGRSHPPTTGEAEREDWSGRLGNKLFLPALIIPATALIGTLAYNYTPLGLRLDRGQARNLCLPRPRRAVRARRHLRLAEAPRNRARFRRAAG